MGNLIIDQKERVCDWVSARLDRCSVPFVGYYAMGVERNGELVAGIVMDNYNAQNAYPHIVIEKTGKDVIQLITAFCDYAFNHCQLKRLTAMIPASKPDVLAFDLKLGFEYEFLMKDGAKDGDLHIIKMTPQSCRWLRGS